MTPEPEPTYAGVPSKAPISGMAIASFALGVISFVPVLGVLLGVIALILGLLGIGKINRGEARGTGLAVTGCILGTLGIATTILLYAFMFQAFRSDSGPFAGPFRQIKIDTTRNALMQTAGQLELYKQKFGRYPEDLDEASRSGYPIMPMDMYQQRLVYRLATDGKTYELFSRGPDGKEGTEDDIRPKR
jgi:hypothetical protein